MKLQRLYNLVLEKHIKEGLYEMAFLSGPRQVGKTTLAKNFINSFKKTKYINIDDAPTRAKLLISYEEIVKDIDMKKKLLPDKENHLISNNPIILFDEIHKLGIGLWKNYLKGFYDIYNQQLNIIVTGSAKLDIYQKKGDSMQGRYFEYTIFPLSIREIIKCRIVTEKSITSNPIPIKNEIYNSLLLLGGFPRPFTSQSKTLHKRWSKSQLKQIFSEDIKDIATGLYHHSKIETLGAMIIQQTGQLISANSIGNKLQAHNMSIKKWLTILENLQFCFFIKPWHKNIVRSLIKEPKVYLYDWSLIEDKGARFENFIAVNLMKYITLLNNLGIGDYDLYYLRNKEKEEIDFLLSQNNKPWIMVECKLSPKAPVNKAFYTFQKQLNTKYMFQIINDLEYVDKDCFSLKDSHKEPYIVPAKTFLSQLV